MEDLIVVHDDLDLPFGRLRFKRRGGDGGHQGVRSIIEAMGGNTFLKTEGWHWQTSQRNGSSRICLGRLLMKAEQSHLE